MNVMNTPLLTATVSRSRRALAVVRDDLRERRRARADLRTLRSELSTYTTQAALDDLLAALPSEGASGDERVREILVRNMQHHQRMNSLAS